MFVGRVGIILSIEAINNYACLNKENDKSTKKKNKHRICVAIVCTYRNNKIINRQKKNESK